MKLFWSFMLKIWCHSSVNPISEMNAYVMFNDELSRLLSISNSTLLGVLPAEMGAWQQPW